MADKREACLSSLCKHATENYRCNHREEEDGVYQTMTGGEKERKRERRAQQQRNEVQYLEKKRRKREIKCGNIRTSLTACVFELMQVVLH